MSTETDATVAPGIPVSFWSPFRYSVFITIWLATLFSDLGLAIQKMGASWLLTNETTSPLYISLIVTASSLPIFLLGIPAGALADIFNKRKILLFSHLWMFLISLAFAIFGFMDDTPPVLLLILSFFLALGPALNETLWPTIISDLVPAEHLPSAITLNGVSLNVARAVGPAVGGLIISYFVPALVFVINAICFLITFLTVYFWKGTATYPALQTERFCSSMRIGVTYMRFATHLHPVFIRCAVFTIGASALWGLLPLVVIQQLHEPPGVYGAALFCVGAGAIAAALLLPRINAVFNIDQKLLISTSIIAINILLLHFNSDRHILFIALFFAGMGWLIGMAGFSIAIQTNVPRWVLSRAISIYILLTQGGMSLGAFLWGIIASNAGVVYGLLSAALWLLASLLLTNLFTLKNLGTTDLTPGGTVNDVIPTLEITATEGPVLVWVDYEITQENIQPFTAAMILLKQLRRRNGASQVGLFQNIISPTVITEFFIVESWSEYLSQISRYTVADMAIENAVLKYHTGATPPQRRIMLGQKDK